MNIQALRHAERGARTAREVALDFIRRGWAPVPIPHREKGPRVTGWQKLCITAETVGDYFEGGPQNVGVLLGAASGNLMDVDLDCPEALAVAPFFLPPTDAVFGRTSTPGAHHLFVTTDRAPGTVSFNDPLAAPDEKVRVVELRGTGGQTVLPGSTHPSGELIEWERNGEPARVSYEQLLIAVKRIAIAAVLARHWVQGTRDDLFVATVGCFLRAGLTDEEIETVARAIAEAAADEKIETRLQAIPRLREALAADGRVTGFPKIAELTDPRVANALQDWLGTEAASSVTVEDFYAYMPGGNFIFVPTRELWPAESVNKRCGNKHSAARVAQQRPVDQMVWAPGEATVIANRLIAEGGWIEREGCHTFNLYRPPQVAGGEPARAGRWRAHLRKLYPNDWQHIECFLAQRVQRPGEKINHALVLGGAQGIGKDSLLEPAKQAVGPWNFVEVSPGHLTGQFNGFAKSVVLRVSEARDLGDIDRYAFYEHMKIYTAAPPDVLRCNEKNLREHAVLNVCGVLITTNHKTGGIFLPPDDRRHFVAWSETTKEQFKAFYWKRLWRWYSVERGIAHVAAYLKQLDISHFDPKAPPPKTAAWWAIVNANRAPEEAELADLLEILGNPAVVTKEELITVANEKLSEFADWLRDKRNARQLPHRMESAGYVPVRNEADKHDGHWKVGMSRVVIYAQKTLALRDQIAAARALQKGRRTADEKFAKEVMGGESGEGGDPGTG